MAEHERSPRAEPTLTAAPRGSGPTPGAQARNPVIVAAAGGRAVDCRKLGALAPSAVLALQRSVGNRNLSRLLDGPRPAGRGSVPSAARETGPDTQTATRDAADAGVYRARRIARRRTAEPLVPCIYLARMVPSTAVAHPERATLVRGPRLLQRYVNYSRKAAAEYARKWALSDNPAYGRIEPNDCTNFVSQALLAGGWTMVGGTCDDRKDDNVWWFKPMECRWVKGRPWLKEVKASFTWGGAQNLYRFMKQSSRGVDVYDPMDLEIGDVLQMDMGPGHYNAGRIGHSMIVTDKTDTELYLSYHEDHHLDEPLSVIRSRYPSATFYPWMPGGALGDYELPSGDTGAG